MVKTLYILYIILEVQGALRAPTSSLRPFRKVETQMNSVIEYHAKIVEIQENEVILDRSPCIKHKVYLVLNFTKKKKESLKSKATEYNKPFRGQSGTPWYGYAGPDLNSGLLTTEVVQHICLNRDLLSVTIPYIQSERLHGNGDHPISSYRRKREPSWIKC